MANLEMVNDSNFRAEVLEASQPVLVDFYADWCAPCKLLGPVLEKVAGKFSGRVKVVKIDTEGSPNTPRTYQVRSIPTLILFHAGEPVDKVVGYLNEEKMTEFIEKHAGPVPS